MPLYEYECGACGERFELIRKFSDPPVEVCTLCGKGPVSRLQSSPAIQFKGSGWYITDYAKKGDGGRTDGDKKGEGGRDEAGKKDAGKTEATPSGSDTSAKSDAKSDTATKSESSSSTSAKSSGTARKD